MVLILPSISFRQTLAFRPPQNHRAVYPPSTASACPITKPAPGLQSHNTAEAISSGLPRRPIGCSFVMSFIVSGSLAIMAATIGVRSEEHTSELQSRVDLVCRLLLEKKK